MSSKKKSKRSTWQRPGWLEIYKSIRKPPTPPGRIIQPKDHDAAVDEDRREMEKWTSWRGEDYEDFEE